MFIFLFGIVCGIALAWGVHLIALKDLISEFHLKIDRVLNKIK